jgi:MFS family permease
MAISEELIRTQGMSRSEPARKMPPSPGVVLPVVLTLLVQSAISMSAVAIPIFMPVAAGELNVPASYVGIFMSVVFLGATLFAPVSGYFIDRLGPIRVSQICLVLCALGLGVISISYIPVMVIGALIMGIGYAPVTPASSHLLVRTTPLSMTSIVFSIKQTGVPLGGTMAGLVVPPLVVFCGWEMTALWVAAFSLILSFCLLPFRNRFDTERSNRSRISLKNAFTPVRMTLQHADLRRMAIASFFFSTMQLCLVSFLVTYLIQNIEMSLIQAGILLSAAQASGIIGRIVWGAFADRYVKPRIMLGILGIGMAGAALAAALFSPQWPYLALLTVCALFGSVAIGWNGVFLAEVARVAKPEHAGVATGGTLFFTFLGILLGLPAFSLVVEKTGSYPFGFAMVAASTFACGIIMLFSRKSR